MLSDNKVRAIHMLVENKQTKVNIAKMLGISRQTLYTWLDDGEFKAELDRVIHIIQIYGESQIKANLDLYLTNIHSLAHSAESEKTRLDANQYLVDRVLGKTTTKIDVEAESRKDNETVGIDTIRAEIAEYELEHNMNNMQENGPDTTNKHTEKL